MNDMRYSFIEPDGTVYYVPGGHHTEWAYEYVDKYFSTEFSTFMETKLGEHKNNKYFVLGTAFPSDFLIYVKGWVLFHNPGMGIPEPTYDNITIHQIESIIGIYQQLEEDFKDDQCVHEIKTVARDFCREMRLDEYKEW